MVSQVEDKCGRLSKDNKKISAENSEVRVFSTRIFQSGDKH